MLRAILYDDGGGELAPLTDLRPSFDIRTGALTTGERLTRAIKLQVEGLIVPAALEALTHTAHALPVNSAPAGDGPWVVLNGRCPLPLPEVESLTPGQRLIEPGTGDTVAACVDAAGLAAMLEGRPPESATIELDQQILLSRPWHARAVRDESLALDINLLRREPTQRPPEDVIVVGDHEPRIGDGAHVYPGVTLIGEEGPIVIAPGATVRPGAIITGPAYIGPGSTVLEHALIRQNTAVGPVCKVAGEIGGTTFQGYANKAHDGYIGDSWIGEWVNLGAGTTTSNLLNTYSDVISQASPGGSRERTGETFLGAIIGDHVKAAIHTRLMAGCVLHTGCMLAQTAPVSGAAGAFSWLTDEGRRLYRIEKFLEVARRVMGRRACEPSEACIDRLRVLHARAEAAENT